jgi:hypothetical protein
MGCGCGGRRNVGSRRSAAPAAQSLQSGVNARQIEVQSNQRQALLQRTKEQLQQQNGSPGPEKIMNSQKEIERKRRIQVSLRNRYGKGNQ